MTAEARRSWAINIRGGRTWSRDHVVLCLITVAAGFGFLACLMMAFGPLATLWWFSPLVFLLLWRFAGSALSLLFWALMFAFWYLRAPDGGLSWWSLPAAACAIVSHAATSLAASIPPEGDLGKGVAARWTAHLAVAIGLASVVAVAAWILRGGTGAISSVAVVVALVLLGTGVFLLRTNQPDTRD